MMLILKKLFLYFIFFVFLVHFYLILPVHTFSNDHQALIDNPIMYSFTHMASNKNVINNKTFLLMEQFLKDWDITFSSQNLEITFKLKKNKLPNEDYPKDNHHKSEYLFKNKIIKMMLLLSENGFKKKNSRMVYPYLFQFYRLLYQEQLKWAKKMGILAHETKKFEILNRGLILRSDLKILNWGEKAAFKIFLPNLNKNINPLNLLSKKAFYVHKPREAKKWDYFRFYFKVHCFYVPGKEDDILYYLSLKKKNSFIKKEHWALLFNNIYKDLKRNLSLKEIKRKYGKKKRLTRALYDNFALYLDQHPNKNKSSLIQVQSIELGEKSSRILIKVGNPFSVSPLIKKLEMQSSEALTYYPTYSKKENIAYYWPIKNITHSDLPGFHVENQNRIALMNYILSLGIKGFSKHINAQLIKKLKVHSDLKSAKMKEKYRYFYKYHHINIKKVLIKNKGLIFYLPSTMIPIQHLNIIPF